MASPETPLTRIGRGAELPPEALAFLLEHGLRRITRRDPSLPCQIVITRCLSRNVIAVSCSCLRLAATNRKGGWAYEPIGVRPSWEPGEAMAAWREHLTVQEAAHG